MPNKATYEELESKIRELKLSESKLKQSQGAIKESEQYLKRAQSISKMGNWYYDWESQTEIWSDELFSLYGVNKDNYPNNIVPESISLNIYPIEIDTLSTSLAQKQDKYELEYDTFPINGQVKTIHSNCEVERDTDGNILKVFGLDHDITERKQAERKIIQAQKAAEAAYQAKSEFIANLSHELRTPLSHIIGFTELVVDRDVGELNEVQEEYLNNSLQSSRHLLSMINNLLDLAKVEADKMELVLSEVCTKGLLASSFNMIKEEALKHDIQLESRIADIKPIMIDGYKLKQVLHNLLSNAIKFTPPGGMITLTSCMAYCIETQASGKPVLQLVDHPVSDKPDQDHQILEALKITVSDTGIGIEAEVINRIFESFEQADGTITRKYGGAGLGLSLSRAFVRLHGGTITAESQGENQGTRFCVLIPIGPYKS